MQLLNFLTLGHDKLVAGDDVVEADVSVVDRQETGTRKFEALPELVDDVLVRLIPRKSRTSFERNFNLRKGTVLRWI